MSGLLLKAQHCALWAPSRHLTVLLRDTGPVSDIRPFVLHGLVLGGNWCRLTLTQTILRVRCGLGPDLQTPSEKQRKVVCPDLTGDTNV